MKKYFLLFVSLVCTTLSFAQQGLNAGVLLNLNGVFILNQNAFGAEEYEYRADIGGGGGLELGYNFTENLGVCIDALYSKQGQKYKDSNGPLTREVKLSYFLIPIMFQYTSSGEGVKFYGKAGPQIGILSSAELVGYDTIGHAPNPARKGYTSSNTGIRFGLGANIPITDILYANGGMDFAYGFNDINATDFQIGNAKNPYAPSHNFTMGFEFGIHYIFGGN